jgi:nitrile hydratase accessory protein
VNVAARLDIDGPAAPPRSNGELVFAEPWEGRAFGLAVTLHQAGAFDWESFRARLIARIAAWESDHEPDERYSYYRCWLDALEETVLAGELVGAGELHQRIEALGNRPAGYDHGHDHDHGHG